VPTVNLRFYEELNEFLPPARRRIEFEHAFPISRSVKDLVEALGVPHTEVDLILVNGRSVDFTYIVQDGDRISVYPVFETIDISPVVRLRPRPLRWSRFVADVHLGKLARLLRLLGFDTLYRSDYRDDELARIAVADGRILLTRDRELLKRSAITRGYWVRTTDPSRQIEEVLARLDLQRAVRPFGRCLRCNGAIGPLGAGEVPPEVPPRVRLAHDRFWRCADCRQVYWEGSHYRELVRRVERLQAGGG
jgi:uncharacterized protein with PIN domain/sulfur carrier protein ThiS